MGKKCKAQSRIQKKQPSVIEPDVSQVLPQSDQLCESELPFKPIIKDIIIHFQKFQELIQSFDISGSLNGKGQLGTKRLLQSLAQRCGFPINTKCMKFFLQDTAIWMSCPNCDIYIEQQDFMQYPQIIIKIAEGQQLIETIMYDSLDEVDHSSEEIVDNNKCRRLKERKIKNVVEKVLKWRQLYAGGEEGKDRRIPLEEGAKIVKISKKTLDDYLAQIKKGRKYFFNFNEHKNDKVGVLRDFIRRCERKNKD